MVSQIKEYNSAQAIADALDKELTETKSLLGEYLCRLRNPIFSLEIKESS